MVLVCVSLLVASMALSLVASRLLISFGHRANTLDSSGVTGQHKLQRHVPNIGGIAIMLALVLPLLAALALTFSSVTSLLAHWLQPGAPLHALSAHLPGLTSMRQPLMLLIACLAVLHVLGVIDDRRPMKAWPKLLLMLLPAIAISFAPGTRLLMAIDTYVGGSWLSIVVTVAWFLVITNALNFLDNMDGLSAGVAAIASGLCMAGALSRGQWFVACACAMVCGACAGFLIWNFPFRREGARIFMGDGGSLLLGFMLALISVRGTYANLSIPESSMSDGSFTSTLPSAWYVILTPLVMLALPLYDFASVCFVRLRAGRSPMMGDRNHLSHRLVRRGLSPRNSVLAIYAITAITGCAGLLLPHAGPTGAMLVAGQVLLLLLLVAMLEFGGQSPLASYEAPLNAKETQ